MMLHSHLFYLFILFFLGNLQPKERYATVLERNAPALAEHCGVASSDDLLRLTRADLRKASLDPEDLEILLYRIHITVATPLMLPPPGSPPGGFH